MYDPYTGTFTQPDPVFHGSANAYGYTSGDPVNHLDLSGDIEFINEEGGGDDPGEGVDPAPGPGGGGGASDGGGTDGALVLDPESQELELLQIDDKIERQMTERGWSDSNLVDTVEQPKSTHAVWDTSEGKAPERATAYVNKGGGYVVVNDGTGRVVQVSDLADPDWKPPWQTSRFRR